MQVGSQEIPGVTGKFGLGVQNETGQRLIEFCQENALVISNTLFQQTREDYKWTRHSKHPLQTTQEKTLQMGITKWSILKSDGLYSLQPKMEKLYTVSKGRELTVVRS